MPRQTIYPTFRYEDARAAIDWLGRAFGFVERVVYESDGVVHHAELALGDALIMLGSVRDASEGGYQAVAPPPGSGSTYVAVEDADALCERARAAGAEIVVDLHDTDYGSRDFTARDAEGNVWSFGTYAPQAGEPPLPA